MDKKYIKRNINELVDAVLVKVDPHYQNQNDVYIEKSRKDIEYTILFTLECVHSKDESILIHYYTWLIETLKHYNIRQRTLFNMIDAINLVLKPYLSEDEIHFLTQIDETVIKDALKEVQDQTYINNPASEIFLTYLIKKDRLGAVNYINSLIEANYDIRKIYLDIIQPSMYEIGRLWQARKLSVADEHMATVITQYVMTSLYPYIFKSEKNGMRLVSVSLGSEQHEIGMRMVTDLFEYEGYETHYLGSNIPIQDIVNYVDIHKPNILAISITLSVHLSSLKQCVTMIRSNKNLNNMKILIGGQAISKYSDPIHTFNVDGFALNANDAIKEGERLVK
jgi:MerR family transcriptional regulator, light-induced transcriptional regulator